MKKTIAILSVAVALNAQAQCCYTDSFSSSSGWTINGVDLTIGTSTFNFNTTPDGAYNYATHSLNCTKLSNTWKADIDFIYTGRGYGVAHTILAATAGSQNAWNTGTGFSSSNQDALAIYLLSPYGGAQSTDSIFGNGKSGTSWGTASGGIHIAQSTQYYLRLEKLSSTQGRISVFTNAARTVHATGSPKTFTFSSSIGNFSVVQSGCIPQGNSARTLTAALDNLKICDTIIPPPQCCDTISYASSTGWTFNGSNLSISSGTFNFNTTPCGAYNYATDTLPCVLSDSSWKSNIDFIYTGRGLYGVAHTLLGVQAGTLDTWNTGGTFSSSNQNALAMYINCPVNGAQTTDSIFGNAKLGSTWGTPSKGIYISQGVQYYLRLERLNYAQGRISVFTNAARTTHITGSPQTFAIATGVTGLHVIEHGCIPQGYSGRTLTGALDNFNICGNIEGYRLASTTGISENKKPDAINIYPNPSNGNFIVEINGSENQSSIMLYDINGKLVISQTIIGKTTIDATQLNAGIYNLSIISNGELTNRRIIITK